MLFSFPIFLSICRSSALALRKIRLSEFQKLKERVEKSENGNSGGPILSFKNQLNIETNNIIWPEGGEVEETGLNASTSPNTSHTNNKSTRAAGEGLTLLDFVVQRPSQFVESENEEDGVQSQNMQFVSLAAAPPDSIFDPFSPVISESAGGAGDSNLAPFSKSAPTLSVLSSRASIDQTRNNKSRLSGGCQAWLSGGCQVRKPTKETEELWWNITS